MRRIALLALASLAGCGLDQIGQAPEMTSIGRAEDNAPPILTAERAAPAPAMFTFAAWSRLAPGKRRVAVMMAAPSMKHSSKHC